MDIEHYKEAIAADPSAPIDAPELSADDRAALEAFREEMLALDRKIGAALAIDVPELELPDLPAIEEDANVVDMPFRNKAQSRAPLWLGLAASGLLVAVLGGRSLLNTNDPSALADEVIAHLDYEPHALVVSTDAVPEQRLHSVVNNSGVKIDSNVGLVTYAQSCIINGKTVPHLVVQGKLGPITLLLMPDESVDRAVPLSGESVQGVILPVGSGSIAIIGEREEDLSEIEQQVVDSVEFSI